MLVLSRKRDEETFLRLLKPLPAGTVIRLIQIEVRGRYSRFCIDADRSEVEVLRGELLARGEIPVSLAETVQK